MKWCLVAVLIFVPLSAVAQTHIAPGPATDGPVSFAVFENRITAAIEKNPDAARFAYFEYTMPGDDEEYAEMGKYGLLVVAAFSRKPSELPLVALKAGDLELRCIGQIDRSVPDGTAVTTLLVAHRTDAFYLVPIAALKQGALLWAEFGGNHSLKMGRLSAEGAIDVIRNDRNPAPTHDPMPDALKDLVAREYPGFGIGISP